MNHIIPIKPVIFNDHGCHMLAEARLNGYKLHLLLDSGASSTVLDISRVSAIFPGKTFDAYSKVFMGFGLSGMKTSCTVIDELQIGTSTIYRQEVLLVDLIGLNKAYAAYDLPRIDGLIGGDILRKYKASIHYYNNTLVINSP